jgi:hypothetical protein
MEPIAVPSGLYLIGLNFCLKTNENEVFFKQNAVNFVKILRGLSKVKDKKKKINAFVFFVSLCF